MPLLIVILGILLLLVLIAYFKLNAFIAFIIVAMLVGLAEGMEIQAVTDSLEKGIGDTLGFLVIILGFGSMLGKLVADSGAAQRITSSLMEVFGKKHIQWALVLTGFIVGVPLFYEVGFVILVPLVFTVAAAHRLPLLYVGLPMLSALSVTHGYLPPHPAPAALAVAFEADIGLTLVYGIIIAIPAITVAGPIFSRTLKHYNPKPLAIFYNPKVLSDDEMPSLSNSILTALLPVILLALTTIIKLFISTDSLAGQIVGFIGNPVVAMLVTVLVAMYTLGLRRGKNMVEVMESLVESVKSVAMILLIIGGAGALKQIMIDSGVSIYIADLLKNADVSPLILTWGIAAVIRVCVGSATVAGLTTVGIVLPMMDQFDADPQLMVLATGAGSLMFSHVNDGGFWLFKEYFNMTIKETLKTWTVMETIVSIMGLLGALIMSTFI